MHLRSKRENAKPKFNQKQTHPCPYKEGFRTNLGHFVTLLQAYIWDWDEYGIQFLHVASYKIQ